MIQSVSSWEELEALVLRLDKGSRKIKDTIVLCAVQKQDDKVYTIFFEVVPCDYQHPVSSVISVGIEQLRTGRGRWK